jgi:tRNA threonylcarbamoyl adenosine modification protein (Sua5/YciO/YrdC/YwlC family)
MAQFLWVHPDDPQARLLKQAISIIQSGGVAAYPTDAGYALGCGLGHPAAVQRMRQIRQLDDKHFFTLLCRDTADLAQYALMDNTAFRMVKRLVPGPYTFILPATREVPRKLLHPKRQTVGVRIPNHILVQKLLEGLGTALLSTTLQLPNEALPEQEGWIIQEKLDGVVDVILDDGTGMDTTPTTVIDLCVQPLVVVREGKGRVDIL